MRKKFYKKQWFLVATLIVLAAVYICFFTHIGRHSDIQISHAVSTRIRNITRTIRRRGKNKPTKIHITRQITRVRFNLDRRYRLTEVKVVPLAGWQTNSSTLPMWHLITDSNSVPILRFFYGERIRGMKPFVAGTRPSPLETNVVYRLFLTAGSLKGHHDFKLPAVLPPPK